MPKVPRVNARRLIKALQRMGFVIVRQKGSHVMLQHDDGRRTIIPQHSGDIPTGTLKGILDDIEVTVEMLKEIL